MKCDKIVKKETEKKAKERRGYMKREKMRKGNNK